MKKAFLIAYHNIIRNLKSPFLLFISISLSMVLMISSFVSIGSFVTYREQLNSNATSDYDLSIFDVKYEKYKTLEIDETVENIDAVKNIGYINLGDNYINNKKYMYLQEMTDETLKNEGFTLKSGRLPNDETEIIVPVSYANIYSKKVGDVVLYQIGWLKENGYYLYEKTSRISLTNFEKEYEFEYTSENIYTIVGIYETSNSLYINNTELSHYYAYSYLNPNTLQDNDIIDVLFRFKETSDLENYALKYSKKLEATASGSDYSNIWTFKTTNKFETKFKLIVYFLTLLLAFSIDYLAVKSALEYGSSETKKFYTRLMSIGATSKDIKNAWDVQIFLIALLAIPFGICLSLLLIYCSVAIPLNISNIDVIISSLLSNSMILISILIMLIVIILANHNSEENILYLIPLESIKGSTESISAKYVRYNNFTKLRGEIDKYVKNNFALKKKIFSQKFVFTLALSISFIMMFLTLNISTTKPLLDYFKTKPSYLTLTVEGEEDYLSILEDISKIPEVIDYSIQRDIDFVSYVKKEDDYKVSIGDIFNQASSNFVKIPINIIAVSDSEFNKYFEKITQNGDVNSVAKNYNLIISSTFLSERFKTLSSNEILSVGTVSADITLYYTDLNGIEEEKAKLSRYIVLDIDNSNANLKTGYQNILVRDSYLETLLEENFIPHKNINVTVSNKTMFLDRMNSYLEGKDNIVINVKNRNYEEIFESVYIDISYLSTFVIVIIGIILLFIIIYETVETYSKSRTKELGLLKSMGVSSKKLESIIYKEYGKSFLISVLLGTILGFVLNSVLVTLFSVSSIEYIDSTIMEIISFASLLVFLVLSYLISVKINTRDIKEKYPIELMKDNFREF